MILPLEKHCQACPCIYYRRLAHCLWRPGTFDAHQVLDWLEFNAPHGGEEGRTR